MLHVRYGKAVRGQPPRRRNVCSVMGWAVDAVADYVDNIRPRFGVPDHPALWVTERGGRIKPAEINARFVTYRYALGLPRDLSPHSGQAAPPAAATRRQADPGRRDRIRPRARLRATMPLRACHTSFIQTSERYMIRRRADAHQHRDFACCHISYKRDKSGTRRSPGNRCRERPPIPTWMASL
jgi:hypothetical protein